MQVQKILKSEYSVLRDTKRVGELSKVCLGDVGYTKRYLLQAKYLKKRVGIESAIGLALGTFTNPIPGGGLIGYILGRSINILRKNVFKIIK